MSRKLGATPLFGKAAERLKIRPIPGVLQKSKRRLFSETKSPSLTARAFFG
jgi:hypothetical protein